MKAPIPSNAATTKRTTVAPGISMIIQRSKGDGDDAMQTQSYRFSKRRFSTEQAKAWLTSHKIKPMEFHPAEESEEKKEKEDRGTMIDRITKEIAQELI